MTKTSEKTTAKCVYKPDSQSTEEFIAVIGDKSNLIKWREGDKTIPLVEILDGFDVFTTGQGKQGILDRPSKQILDSVFSTTNMDDILAVILEKGEIQETKSLSAGTGGSYQTRRDDSGLSRGSVGGGR